MNKVKELLSVNVFAPVAVAVAGVEEETLMVFKPVTGVPLISTAKIKEGVPEPFV